MFQQHARTAFVHIRRSPYQALAAISIMTLTFFVATVFAILAYAMSVTVNYFETRPQVIAFLKNEATPDETSSLQKKLSDNSRIRDVRFVSQEEAFRIFKETMDSPLATDLVSPEVLPASLEFSVTQLSFAEEIIEDVKKEGIVDRVEFTASLGGQTTISNVIQNLQRITKYVRIGGLTMLSFLSLTAILTLLVIIGMRVASRREEINVLKLIGATSSFIRSPFLLEGIIYSVVGALLGFLVALLLFLYLTPTLSVYFAGIPILPKELNELIMRFGTLLALEVAAGIIVGFIGAWLALTRYLRL